ncbi:hypothetical protein GLOIN_2v990783 [Rhizophagus clarus]|uniref:Uncharacterized protein n=1 Tax=Rhizophagus clarus TaxID=94130 RepID=A0A8H3KV79_9GLOM|nr:hypothetical protein GLOIN_2v990783 [Rhizophagus clarus]
MHLIPGAKQCFSEIVVIRCNAAISNNGLNEFIGVCELVRELEFYIEYSAKDVDYSVFKLIDVLKKLTNITFLDFSGFTLHEDIHNKKFIQTIYNKCSRLEYLKLNLISNNMTEFEKILINYQYLRELFILVDLSAVLSTPIKLESLKLFCDNWKGRRPISLQLDHKHMEIYDLGLINLIKKNTREKGLLK